MYYSNLLKWNLINVDPYIKFLTLIDLIIINDLIFRHLKQFAMDDVKHEAL